MPVIAVIGPRRRPDHLTRTLVDGLASLQEKGLVSFHTSATYGGHDVVRDEYALPRDPFIAFAREADLVLFCWGKDGLDAELPERVDRWEKTVYVDGSEPGHNRRLDYAVQRNILAGTHRGQGAIDTVMLARCPLYFRREKPYLPGILPLPFGIERRYRAEYRPGLEKPIDFFCVFGQDRYSTFRRHARAILREFCAAEGYSCVTSRLDNRLFYQLLACSKVGISIGGSGYDTGRFWEVLGNNCLLITEAIDIFESESDELAYERIYECGNLYDFEACLRRVGTLLRGPYGELDLLPEYSAILARHSSEARILTILEAARRQRIVSF
jgi:hypothetical protein